MLPQTAQLRKPQRNSIPSPDREEAVSRRGEPTPPAFCAFRWTSSAQVSLLKNLAHVTRPMHDGEDLQWISSGAIGDQV